MQASDRSELTRINHLLKEKILQHVPLPGKCHTAIKGLMISRREEINHAENCLGKPSVAVIVQGFKCATIGSTTYTYGENQCIVTGVDIPSSFHVRNPSAEKPFLAVCLDLDKYLLTQLALEMPPSKLANRQCQGVSIGDVEPDVLGAFLRLVELLEKPEQIAIRAPMVIREIHYLLLMSPQGKDLQQLNTLGTQSNQIAQAINWLKEHYKSPLQVDTLARQVHMARSTFHRHFKDVTGFSPLQFHKQLRLHEAQRLMLTENQDAGNAGLTVGYESATQFNREYKRLFGEPPLRDMNLRRVAV